MSSASRTRAGDLLVGRVGVLAQRIGDVVEPSASRTARRSGRACRPAPDRRRGRRSSSRAEVDAVEIDAPRVGARGRELEQHALAGAGAAEDDERLAAMHVEATPSQHGLPPNALYRPRSRSVPRRPAARSGRQQEEQLGEEEVGDEDRDRGQRPRSSVVARPTPSAPPVRGSRCGRR